MSLLDVLNGMRNGPRGAGSAASSRGGGTSPLLLAALGLLAYKAYKSFDHKSASAQPAPGGAPSPAPQADHAGGDGLGGLLQSLGLGGAAAGGLGGILSGGLGDLVKQFQNAGKGELADSWVGTGQNKALPATDLADVLTPEQIEFLMARTGLSREALLSGLSQQLPEVVDRLTPQGRLPAPHELDRA